MDGFEITSNLSEISLTQNNAIHSIVILPEGKSAWPRKYFRII